MLVTKDILYPGTYHLPDGRDWTCTPGDVRNACVMGNRMQSSGNLSAPLIWGHDWAVDPVPLGELLSTLNVRDYQASVAKNCIGFAKSYSLEVHKGEPVLLATIEIPREQDAKQFERTRYVSPRVNTDFTDTYGRFWPGTSIGHIASTPLPVQQRQQPVMLSTLTPTRTPNSSRFTVFLSLDSKVKKMADKEDKKEEKKEGGEGEGAMGCMPRILSALAMMGHQMPDSVKSPDDLALALETMAANGMGGSGDEPDGDEYGGDEDETPQPGQTESAVTPAMLSAMPLPARQALETSANNGKQDLLSRLARVEKVGIPRGVVTKADVDNARATITKADTSKMLSVLGSGSKKSRAVFQLETWEKALGIKPGKKNNAPVDLSNLQAVDAPKVPGGNKNPTEDEIKKAAERARERVAVKRTK